MSDPVYVRAKDPDTGHEFDVRQDSLLLTQGRVAQVKPRLYPPARYRRPAKHHLDLAGQSVTQNTDASTETTDPATTTEEN